MTHGMLYGAIAGDIIGSRLEFQPEKDENFDLFKPASRFTDDTVMTIAVADAILMDTDYAPILQKWGRRYPNAGYGGNFNKWLRSFNPKPYGSYGNGSAMRVSPVGWAYESVDEVLKEAARSAEITHNHPEGIKGAQAVALAIFLARTGKGKPEIKKEIEERFGYDLGRVVSEIRPRYHFDVTCQGSVSEAILCFLESDSTMDAIRKAVSLGGDADTQACIAGAIGEAYYGSLELWIVDEIQIRLPEEMRFILSDFGDKYRGAKWININGRLSD